VAKVVSRWANMRSGRYLSANKDPDFSCSFSDHLPGDVSLIARGALKYRSIAKDMVFAGASIVTIAAVVAAMVLIVSRREAVAWSAYSSQTGLRCEQCHTRSGNLTELGKRFKANGNKLPEPKP
jgi:hypothetical protein